MKKRVLSILLCVCMMLAMLPATALAVEEPPAGATVSIGGVTVAGDDWYAATDESGTVTECVSTDEWNIHVSIVDADEETGGVESTTSAAITLRNATIKNEGEADSIINAISVSNCDLNITLEGTANQIGTVASNNVYGYAIYAETGNNVTITGDGDLTLKGYYGINVNGSGTVSINTTGSLDITSWYQMIWCNNSLDISADSIDADGYYFMAGEASLSATEGDISITGSYQYGIQAYGDVTVAALNGAISLSGINYAIKATGYSVNVSAKNDIVLTGTVNGKEIYAASEMGSVTIDGHYNAIESAQTAVTLSAPAGDIILSANNVSNIISGTNYTLAITAGGTLNADGPYGIVNYENAVIKAENVYVSLSGTGYGFNGGALTITNPEGGNCSKVSISGGAGNYDAINAYGDINIKADQVEIMAAPDAQNAIKAYNISNPVAVTIGDSGVIVGEIYINGVDQIADGVARAAVYGNDATHGNDASHGLNLSGSDVPKVSTYYSANISGDSGYIVWEPEINGSEYIVAGTITLHDAEIAGSSDSSGIVLPGGYADIPVDGIRLILEGDSTINYATGISCRGGYTNFLNSFTVSEGANGGSLSIGSTYSGIYLTCPITVEGGTLDVTSYENHAILTSGSNSDITIDGGTVNAVANASASDDDEPYMGIYSQDGDVIITGGSVDASGTGGSIGAGTDCRVDLSDDSAVDVTGPIIVEGTSAPAQLSDIFSKAKTVTGTVNNATVEVHDYTGGNDSLVASYDVSGVMDITTSGLDWYNEGGISNIPLEQTTYKAGDGNVVFTPAEGENPANLSLSNATAGTLDISAAGDIVLELTGNNTIDSENGGSIIADNITLTGSGSLTATGSVDQQFYLELAGIIARNGFTDNSSGELNAIVAEDHDSSYDFSVYGSATIDGDFEIFEGDTFIVTPDAVLTISEDGCLDLCMAASIFNNGLIANNGEIVLPGGYTVEQVEALDISGSGIVILYDAEADIERVIVNGAIYAYVNARYDGGPGYQLDFTEVPDEATYYDIYNGYIIFTPAIGENPAVLALYDVGEQYVAGPDDEYPGRYMLLDMTLPDIPLELQLHGENQLSEIQNSESITVSGSGVLDAEIVIGSNPSAVITVNSGATLNTKYQTYYEEQHTETNTIYGRYELSNIDNLLAENLEGLSKVVLAPGAALTLEDESFLKVGNFDYLTIGEGASIVNNSFVILPRGTTAGKIAELPLIGDGVVKVITSEPGAAETYGIYTNDGTALTVIDDLDLSDATDEIPESEGRGYSWTSSGEGDSQVWTLALSNAYISGGLTLPDETVVISSMGDTFIDGNITLGYYYPCDLTITGSGRFTAGGVSGSQGGNMTVSGGASVVIDGEVNFGSGAGSNATVNVTGTGSSMIVSSSYGTAVYCDTVNIDDGASLTVSAQGSGSRGINALTGVNVTGGSTLTTNCDYGVYIIGGNLIVDDDSTLVTNASVAPFCVVDETSLKSQNQVVSLPGLPAGTAIASVTGTDAGRGYNYWSLVPTGGSLGVENEYNEPVALSGAVTGRVTFAKAPDPDDDDPGRDDPGSGSGSINYTVTFETNGGSVISTVSGTAGTVIDLSAYLPTRDGFDFEGWYSDTALTKKVTSVELTKNAIVYSKWTKKSEQIKNPFTDVSDSAYYYNAVIWAVGKGITNGTTSTTFSPEAITTRAQTAAFLWRTMGSPEPVSTDCPFKDVAKDAYYYKALLWATEKGITVGTSSATFSPDDTVTRCQTVTFLWRMADKPSAAGVNPFADVTGNAYYYAAALWAAEQGITQGVSPTAFGPADPCERAQIVTFLYRYIGLADSE